MHVRSKYLALVAILFLVPILLSTTSVMAGSVLHSIERTGEEPTTNALLSNPANNVITYNLPPVLTKPLFIDGRSGTVVLKGTTTVSFTNPSNYYYYAIEVYDATKIIIDNVVINVKKISSTSAFFALSIVGERLVDIVGNYLYINMSPEISQRTQTLHGLFITNAKSIRFDTIKINMNPVINTKAAGYGIDLLGITILTPGSIKEKLSIYINKIICSMNPSLKSLHTRLDVGLSAINIGDYYIPRPNIFNAGYSIAAPVYFSYYTEKTRISATINSIIVQYSGAKNIVWGGFNALYTWGTDLTLKMLVVRDINFVKNPRYSLDSQITFSIIRSLFSNLEVRRILAYNVVNNVYRSDTTIFGDLRYTNVKYGFILTRNFGTGSTYSWGGIIKTYVPFSNPIGRDIRTPYYPIGIQYLPPRGSDVRISHMVLKNTPGDVSKTGIRELKGKVLVIGRGTGVIYLYPSTYEMREPIIIPVKNQRITIILDQKYRSKFLSYYSTMLVSSSMINMIIRGENIKVVIDGKTYIVSYVQLSIPQAIVRSFVKVTDGSGHSFNAIARPGLIGGFYTITGMRD